MSNLEDKAVELITNLQSLGPQLTDVALNTASVMALQNIVYGFIGLVILLVSLYVFFKLVVKGLVASFKGYPDEYLIYASATGVTFFLGLTYFVNTLSVINWVGIWHPEIFIVYKIIL